LGVSLQNIHTEVYISNEDREKALPYIKYDRYGFVQTHTGVPKKDLPVGFGKIMLENYGLPCVEVGVDFGFEDININVQFAIMEKAEKVIVPDSVFYHACGALDKTVDFAYFARGKSVYDRVKPLHEVKQNIVYTIGGQNAISSELFQRRGGT